LIAFVDLGGNKLQINTFADLKPHPTLKFKNCGFCEVFSGTAKKKIPPLRKLCIVSGN
jgi:hypothetical protein